MGVSELGLRVGRAARTKAGPIAAPRWPRLAAETPWETIYTAFKEGTGRPNLFHDRDTAAMATRHAAEIPALLELAERWLDHRATFFAYPEAFLGSPIDWHRDAPSGTQWPEVPANRVDTRTAPPDPKWIWELHRLQQLPLLASAWRLTGDQRFADEALEQLDGYITANPPGMGVGWKGGFEAGMRAIAVGAAMQGLANAPGFTLDRFRSYAELLAECARRAWQERSLHSSANNHLIGELAGCVVAAMMLPELTDGPELERRALAALSVEATRQIHPDGMSVEQAFAYQIFAAELLLVPVALVTLRGERPPGAMLAALERGATFIAQMIGDGNPPPRYGDDDEGFALRLGGDVLRNPRGHIAAVAALTGNGVATGVGCLDLTADWLIGIAELPGAHHETPGSFLAPGGGLVVLRDGPRRVIFDAAPLGYRSIAAHGHADALSVTLAEGGIDLIGDPGTGSYYGHPDWRTAHRGTRAHATVAVDGVDQSVMGGPFLWTDHADATLLASDLAVGYAAASHPGYRRLADPVDHQRQVVLVPGGPLVVVDRFTATAAHEYTVSWPVHPDLELADGEPHRFSLDGHPRLTIVSRTTGTDQPFQIRGDEATALGWWSDRLEARRPSWLVGNRMTGVGTMIGVSLIWTSSTWTSTWPDPGLQFVSDADGVLVTWRDGIQHRALRLNPDHPHMGPVLDPE